MSDQITQLCQDTEHVHSREELAEKLKLGRPLRIKLGVDPTAPDIHLGHAVPLRKLRQFQDLGHQVVLIIGDFTAMIGDPSGRSVTRPPLTHEEVMANAKTFTDQAFLIIDKEKTEVVYNGDWFSKMPFQEVIKLNAKVTMQQMLQREDFKKRVAEGQEVRLHEIQYPIMQGWDSVVINSDVEIGGTDQLFNVLVGRDLQKGEGMPAQVVLTLPLLEGLDGNKKMSKSLGNYVGLTEAPSEMFGKLMSISDQLMPRYYRLVIGEDFDTERHPMEAKKYLAQRTVEIYHDAEAASEARADFENKFGKGKVEDAELPEVPCPPAETPMLSYISQIYADTFHQKRSNGDIRRLVQQGSIQINGEKQSDPKAALTLKTGDVLKLDKKRLVRIG
ncbi:MAG: tyrosine--tRNA ligase [Verrucomicrobiales bacterium]|jgi:tyrosyl-tRNA synthetase|nr:tyrosine--tRNA ligase [Verrucomicrobiales bacterium]